MKAKTSAVEVFCKTCSKSVGLRFPCHLKRSKNFFCGIPCKATYQLSTHGERANKAICVVCHEPFIVKPSHIELGRKNCSGKCRSIYISWFKREDAFHWKGGWVMQSGYIVEGDILQHRRVMEQHLHRNLSPEEVVHHIDYNKKNNVIENLVVMSRSAHTKRHWAEGVTHGHR